MASLTQVRKYLKRKPNVKSELIDSAIFHALMLERWKNYTNSKIRKFVRFKFLPSLFERLAAGIALATTLKDTATVNTNKRLRDIIYGAGVYLTDSLVAAGNTLNSELRDLVLSEARWQKGAVNAAIESIAGTPLKLDFTLPAASTLKSIVDNRTVNGKLVTEWFEQLAVSQTNEIVAAINVGIAAGDSTDTVVEKVVSIIGNPEKPNTIEDAKLFRSAEAIVRTATQNIANQARLETYKQNEDVISGWQFVATLDSRTTPICIEQDGKKYKVGEGRMPPLHMGCRSTTIPILKTMAELGLPFEEFEHVGRASKTGPVSAKLDYSEWLRFQPKADVVHILGKERAELFLRNKYHITRYINDGKFITLEELERMGIRRNSN